MNGVKDPSSISSKKESSSSSSGGGSVKGGKEKQKVSKPPPDTKKPPKLLQSPCQFLSTSNIYGSPKSDLIKESCRQYKKKFRGGEGKPSN